MRATTSLVAHPCRATKSLVARACHHVRGAPRGRSTPASAAPPGLPIHGPGKLTRQKLTRTAIGLPIRYSQCVGLPIQEAALLRQAGRRLAAGAAAANAGPRGRSTLVSTALGLSQLILVFRLNEQWGIPSEVFCLGAGRI